MIGHHTPPYIGNDHDSIQNHRGNPTDPSNDEVSKSIFKVDTQKVIINLYYIYINNLAKPVRDIP